MSHSNASELRRNSSVTRLAHRVDLIKHLKSRVALALAWILSLSPPATTISRLHKSSTPTTSQEFLANSVVYTHISYIEKPD